MSESGLTSASFGPQSPASSILATGPRQPCALVELDQPVDQRLARQHLQLGIERGAHRKAALVERLLAVLLVDLAADLFGEIFGGEDVRAGRARGDVERLLLGLLAVGRLDRSRSRPSGR